MDTADPRHGRHHRVVVADDDGALRTQLAVMLRDRFEVYEAGDGNEALALALKVEPDVVIADQRMPGMNGIDVLAAICDRLPFAQRVLMTGYADYGPAVEAVNTAKVHAYVEKPFHTAQLVAMLEALLRAQDLERERALLVARLEQTVASLEIANTKLAENEARLDSLVRERTHELARTVVRLEQANAKLSELATHDDLTGLFNHRYLVDYLRIEVARSQRYGRPLSILFVDIDDFKRVNDTHGHAVGDRVLKGIADAISIGGMSGLRRSDVAARYGGEEFCVILCETPPAGALVKAERIRETIEQMAWDGGVRITVSIGMASYPEHGVDDHALLRAADDALYQAKRAGKNRVVLAPPLSSEQRSE